MAPTEQNELDLDAARRGCSLTSWLCCCHCSLVRCVVSRAGSCSSDNVGMHATAWAGCCRAEQSGVNAEGMHKTQVLVCKQPDSLSSCRVVYGFHRQIAPSARQSMQAPIVQCRVHVHAQARVCRSSFFTAQSGYKSIYILLQHTMQMMRDRLSRGVPRCFLRKCSRPPFTDDPLRTASTRQMCSQDDMVSKSYLEEVSIVHTLTYFHSCKKTLGLLWIQGTVSSRGTPRILLTCEPS